MALAAIVGATFLLWRYEQRRRYVPSTGGVQSKKDQTEPTDPDDSGEPPLADKTPLTVKVLHPRCGAMERVTVQVGSVQAYESVQLHAKVSGYLKKQEVDIGDRVKKGDKLAFVDVPELEKQVEKNDAVVQLSEARVKQMEAKVAIAEADKEAAKAQIIQAAANAKAATAWVAFRTMQEKRMKALASGPNPAVEEKLWEEAKERLDAAVESENAAKAAIATANAKVMSADAKILLAKADLLEAKAQVKVAQAEYGKSRVQLGFATITAPFDGIITQRILFPGDFVRSAGEGGGAQPLLTIQRTDRMRVVVQIPDRDVPFTDRGDPALLEINAFPGEKFPAKVSRVAGSEDPQTRMMRVEIDLPNPNNRIRQGMFGKVTILLDKAMDKMSLPTECLVGKATNGRGSVYVVREGKVHRAKIEVGMDNGLRVEILRGLALHDHVIFQPSSLLSEELEVQTTLLDENELKPATEPS